MKKQNKTYVLLAIVLGIWGLIAFKFFAAANPSEQKITEGTADQVFVPKQIKDRETFTIAANYRDPFLGTVQAPKKKLKKSKSSPAKPKKMVPTKLIQYTGFITDTSSKQKIFFVTVDGQQQMMAVNDTFQDVKLVRGTKSSIKVKYNGSTEKVNLSK